MQLVLITLLRHYKMAQPHQTLQLSMLQVIAVLFLLLSTNCYAGIGAIAEQKGVEVTQLARNNGFPLVVKLEPEA